MSRGVIPPSTPVDAYVLRSTLPINVKDYGAVGNIGSTDQTAAFTAARDAAGAGGTIYVPSGTYYVKDFDLLDRQSLIGGGVASILAPATGASYIARLSGKLQCKIEGLLIDGIGTAGIKGIVITGSASTSSQTHLLERVRVTSCAIGISVEQGTASQVDKNTYLNVDIADCTTAMKINSVNAQEQVLINCVMNGGTTGIDLIAGSLHMLGGQFQGNSARALHINGANVQQVRLEGVITEGCAVDIEGTAFWPSQSIVLDVCVMAGNTNTVKMGTAGSTLIGRATRFNNVPLLVTGADCTFEDEHCTFTLGASINATAATSFRHHRLDREGTWYKGAVGDGAVKVSRYTDTNPRASVTEAGFKMGSGSAVEDVAWARTGAAAAQHTGSLRTTGTLNVNDAVYAFASGKIGLNNTDGTGFLEFREQSPDPAAPSANYASLFCRDNGAGKTQLCVRFATGAVQVIATEP